jgi:hypothetical protein
MIHGHKHGIYRGYGHPIIVIPGFLTLGKKSVIYGDMTITN